MDFDSAVWRARSLLLQGWSQDATRTELIALGLSYQEAVQAINTAQFSLTNSQRQLLPQQPGTFSSSSPVKNSFFSSKLRVFSVLLVTIFFFFLIFFYFYNQKSDEVQVAEQQSVRLDNSALRTAVLGSLNDLTSYSFSSKGLYEKSWRALGGQQESGKSNLDFLVDGTLDYSARKIYLKQHNTFYEEWDFPSYFEGDFEVLGQAGNHTSSSDKEFYIIDNTFYFTVYDKWIKITQSEDLFAQDEDALLNLRELIQNGTFVILREEEIRGRNNYVVRLNVDTEQLNEDIRRRLNATGEQSERINIDSYEYILHVDSENYFPQKATSSITGTIEHLSFSDNEPLVNTDYSENFEITFYDFNVPSNIELPLEAQNASDLSGLYELYNSFSENSSEGEPQFSPELNPKQEFVNSLFE